MGDNVRDQLFGAGFLAPSPSSAGSLGLGRRLVQSRLIHRDVSETGKVTSTSRELPGIWAKPKVHRVAPPFGSLAPSAASAAQVGDHGGGDAERKHPDDGQEFLDRQ